MLAYKWPWNCLICLRGRPTHTKWFRFHRIKSKLSRRNCFVLNVSMYDIGVIVGISTVLLDLHPLSPLFYVFHLFSQIWEVVTKGFPLFLAYFKKALLSRALQCIDENAAYHKRIVYFATKKVGVMKYFSFRNSCDVQFCRWCDSSLNLPGIAVRWIYRCVKNITQNIQEYVE